MMRPIPTFTLLICLALGACRTTDDPAQTASPAPASVPASPGAASPAPAAGASPPPAAAAEPAAPAQRRAPAQAARGSAPPQAPPAQAEPPDMDQALAIRQTCWQLVDKNKAIKSLEARADWVSKCIADKNKAAGI